MISNTSPSVTDMTDFMSPGITSSLFAECGKKMMEQTDVDIARWATSSYTMNTWDSLPPTLSRILNPKREWHGHKI